MLNTAAEKTLSQTINIITAMSTDGDVWIALTTCNTDSDVLMLFMTQLASVLTKEQPNWRDSTVFLLDGVSGSFDYLIGVAYIGSVSQVRGESCLLQASRIENSTKWSV